MVLLLKYGGKEKKQVEHNTVGKNWKNIIPIIKYGFVYRLCCTITNCSGFQISHFIPDFLPIVCIYILPLESPWRNSSRAFGKAFYITLFSCTIHTYTSYIYLYTHTANPHHQLNVFFAWKYVCIRLNVMYCLLGKNNHGLDR